jgi:hypothetical protein
VKRVLTWFLRLSPAVLAALLAYAALYRPWGLLFSLGVHPYPAGTPWTYQLWSGFVPALTVLSLLGTLVSLYHLKNCHRDGCWRLGKHVVNGAPWCSVHVSGVMPELSEHDLLTEILAVQRQQLACLHSVLCEVKRPGEDSTGSVRPADG